MGGENSTKQERSVLTICHSVSVGDDFYSESHLIALEVEDDWLGSSLRKWILKQREGP
jgi:hypothetical protein